MTSPAAGHRIRLRGPWKIVRSDGLNRESAPVETRRHPEEWPAIVNAQSGQVLMTRAFHAPSHVDDRETVFVVLTGVRGDGHVWLNGRTLGRFAQPQSIWEFAIPFALPFSNELTIDVTFPSPTNATPLVGVYDVVALDIRNDADPNLAEDQSAAP